MQEQEKGREWNASVYHQVSAPQTAWGNDVLASIALRGDEHALDIGCGTGKVTAELLARLPRGHVVALDASTNMIEQAARTLAPFGDRVKCIALSALELDHDRAYDLVFSTATFHWIPDHAQLFRNIFRALKPGGWLVSQAGGAGNLARARALARPLMSSPAYAKWFGDWDVAWEYPTAEHEAQLLAGEGFVEIETSLTLRPTPFTDRAQFRAFLETVVFRMHLECITEPAAREQFVNDLLDLFARADPPDHLDYVRVNIRARRPV